MRMIVDINIIYCFSIEYNQKFRELNKEFHLVFYCSVLNFYFVLISSKRFSIK